MRSLPVFTRTAISLPFLLATLGRNGIGDEADTQQPDQASRIFLESAKSVVVLVIRSESGNVTGSGTGFLVAGGKIVTNEHVARAGNVFIDLGAAFIPTSVERVDATNDLALLSARAELALKPLTLSDRLPATGATVYVIGNPAGLERTFSSGIISGIRDFTGRQLLQITAPISPGSSGGPVLDDHGQVVGVTVGMLKDGQNLNFAVPVTLVRRLLTGERLDTSDVLALLAKSERLIARRGQEEFSMDPDSAWQALNREVNSTLQSALDNAGNEADLLLKVATRAEADWQQIDVAIAAADRSVAAKPSPDGFLLLGKALKAKALFADEGDKPALLERAEKALKAAVRVSKQPSSQVHYQLAETLSQHGELAEAEGHFRRALELSKAAGEPDLAASSLRGLVRTAFELDKEAEGNAWFKVLADSGKANAWDWHQNGQRLDVAKRWREAGESYQLAALRGGEWTNWCEAAGSYAAASGDEEATLSTARRCIAEGSGKTGSEGRLAAAHGIVARALNRRGVHQEALSHAREAIALDPSDAWAFDAQAEALLRLRRFQEAINASSQAIRLADGKYSTMHFHLGAAYFGTENWEFAKQSYEKAAQLNPTDDASPYNVALCLIRLGYQRDAARWFEEVLRRNPNHPDRQDILTNIQALRR